MNRLKPLFTVSIIPLIVIIGSYLFLTDISRFFLSWYDPSYVYLFNGLNLAQGSLEIGHTDHPGTPLQVYCAFVIRLVWFFKSDASLVESVLSDPEFYLHSISYSLILLNSLILFIAGLAIFNVGRNLNIAFFIQLIPIVSVISMERMPVVASESLLFGIGILLVSLSFICIFYNNKIKVGNYVYYFSILSALSIAVKISSFTVVFVPLFLLPDNKSRFRYMLLTIILFFLFILPIIGKFLEHSQFLLKILTHTGIYGSGDSGLLNADDFRSNLAMIFTNELPFTFSYFGVFIVSVLILFKRGWFKNVELNKRKYLYGILTATTIQILLVAKHYNFHYLIPVYSFSVLSIYVIFRILQSPIPQQHRAFLGSLLVSVGLVVITILLTVRLYYGYSFYPNLNNPLNTTVKFMEVHDKLPRILMLDGIRETAFIEPALYFGLVYSGELKHDYVKYFTKKYPFSYFYSNNKGLFNWNNNVMHEEVLSKFPEILVYARDRDTLRISKSLKSILKNMGAYVSLSKIYLNNETNEHLYRLKIDTSAVSKLIGLEKEVFCDMEIVDYEGKSFLDISRQHLFKGAGQQSVRRSVSGNSSIKIGMDAPYGMETYLTVTEGGFVKIQVWRYSNNNAGMIVASSSKASVFYKGSSSVIKKESNGWGLLELSFYVPEGLPNNQLKIYLWNNGRGDVYFDNLCIKEYKGNSANR